MRSWILAVLPICLACPLPAQETRGMIPGTITDAQSAAVMAATVTAANAGTNVPTRLTNKRERLL